MNPNLQTNKSYYYKNILLSKLSKAVCCSLLSQFIILVVYIFYLKFNIFSPLSTFVLFISTITSLGTWVYFTIFLALVFAQSVICAKDYVINPKYPSSRFQKYIAILSLHNLLLVTLHVIVGFVTVWLFLKLSEFNDVVTTCEERFCLVEDSFYLHLLGAWIGFYYCLKACMSEKKILFPVVQQMKWLQFKVNLIAILKTSKAQAFWPIGYFVIAYTLFASYLATSLGVKLVESNANFYIYLLTWFFGVLIYFNLNLMTYFYQLFLTEPVEFPILNVNNDCLTLMEAISINVPVIQHLASLDFFLLAGISQERRQLIFSLSQPGGHPHNWNNLIESSLKILKEYTVTLNKATSAILNADKIKPQLTEAAAPQQTINYDQIRNMSLNFASNDNSLDNLLQTMAASSEILPEKSAISRKISELNAAFRKRFGIDYLFNELPEANIHRCLGDGQVIMWITQALSSITVCSLEEDRYGVVQKDLPIIISSLVELKISVDKLNRIPIFNRKVYYLDDFNTKMKVSILNTIKRSLYHICNSFGPYLRDLNLKKDIVNQLEIFIPIQTNRY